ncbi:MAG: hypothetical protein HYZ14_17210 [Bacteroidetes bacterium]|nr:hypothetical protein [Bacteroidota bacterium]
MRTSFLFFLLFILNINASAQQNGSTLYLENTVNGKIKKLKLDRTAYMTLYIDSLDGAGGGGLSYTTFDPLKSSFGKQEMIFAFEEYTTYSDVWSGESNYYSESYGYLEPDSLVKLPYQNSNREIDLRLTHQTRFRNAMYNFGVGVCIAALFNAVIISPVAGMNNGSFSNYNWNRFLQYELYSAAGLAGGITLGVSFLERDFYFQTTSSYYSVWRVVDGE